MEYSLAKCQVKSGSVSASTPTINSAQTTVTYSDGMPLAPNQLLAANSTEKYRVRIEYRTDIELNQIPATNQNLTLQFTVNYRQATDNTLPAELKNGIIDTTVISGHGQLVERQTSHQ